MVDTRLAHRRRGDFTDSSTIRIVIRIRGPRLLALDLASLRLDRPKGSALWDPVVSHLSGLRPDYMWTVNSWLSHKIWNGPFI